MRNSTLKRLKSFKSLFVVVLFFVSSQIRAQFPFLQFFKNTTAPEIEFGGTPTSFLSASSIDANGSGYLRLTNNGGDQKGYVWSDANAFQSSYEINISFECHNHACGGFLDSQKSTENGFQGVFVNNPLLLIFIPNTPICI
jgi:hypothetical protein